MTETNTGPPFFGRVATFSLGIARLAHARALIGCEKVVFWPRSARGIDAVVGWGLKNNTYRAMKFAYQHGLPYWRLEDGFLRSVGLGVEGDTGLSMVLDDLGMYYDARRPSRLEQLLEADGPILEAPEHWQRAEAAMNSIREFGLSKYNSSPVVTRDLSDSAGRKRVLVVDQSVGDLSVFCGFGNTEMFSSMLKAALDENPNADIIVKTHPDVVGGKKSGYLGPQICRQIGAGNNSVHIVNAECNPIRLLEKIDKVYVVTSQLGFEALLVGKLVVCFGAPFYSGWGLTDDRSVIRRRKKVRSLAEVFAAAYLRYSRYVNPDTGEACGIETVIDHLALQRQEYARNQGKIFCFGFRLWKRNYVRSYLRCPGNEILFPRSAAHAVNLGFDSDSTLLTWGQRATRDVSTLSSEFGTPIRRMEDGFLRSVGLGSDMVVPASVVVDHLGIYYDPRAPSELESILQNAEFGRSIVERAARLRTRLVESGLSKYNVGDHRRTLAISPGEKRVVLVPGQVEDDASIRLGCPKINTNIGLLHAVRSACPDAYLIFKPHPDVLSGNRVGAVLDSETLEICDHVETEASLGQCFSVAEEVHVMTSLAGFEALLRGLEVHVYGQPFYGGWGLTTDRYPVRRRTRVLTLDQLVAATYILYPRYLNRKNFRFTSVEMVLSQLEIDRERDCQPLHITWPRRQLRKCRHIASEVIRGA